MNTPKIHSLLVALLMALTLVGCSKPDMPVSVSFRPALLDNSLVARFRNKSDRHLTVVVKFENRTLNQQMSSYIVLGPRETKEIGWLEGWAFMSGEYITMSHEDYSTKTVRVP